MGTQNSSTPFDQACFVAESLGLAQLPPTHHLAPYDAFQLLMAERHVPKHDHPHEWDKFCEAAATRGQLEHAKAALDQIGRCRAVIEGLVQATFGVLPVAWGNVLDSAVADLSASCAALSDKFRNDACEGSWDYRVDGPEDVKTFPCGHDGNVCSYCETREDLPEPECKDAGHAPERADPLGGYDPFGGPGLDDPPPSPGGNTRGLIREFGQMIADAAKEGRF